MSRSQFLNLVFRVIFAISAFFAISASFLSVCTVQAQEHPKYLKVGAAVVDSTPTVFPVTVNGGFLPSYAEKVHDPLHVRAIVIDDGTTCIAMLTADICILSDEVVRDAKAEIVKRIPIPAERIMISATHCHSAPAVVLTHAAGIDENYLPLFREKLIEAAVKAYGNRQDARVAWGKDFDPKNVFCRRFLMKEGKASSVDPDLTGSTGDLAQMNPGSRIADAVCRTGNPNPAVYVVSFQTPEGKPLALMANYSTHYAGSRDISADYFGVFCEEIKKRLNADDSFFAVLTNGTSGDTNCIDFYDPGRTFDMYTVGNSVADAAFRACAKMTYQDWVPVKMTDVKMTVRMRKGTPEQVAKAKKHLADLEAAGKEVSTITDAYAINTVRMDGMPDLHEVTLQAIRIGDVGITILPNETYSATGHTIRAASKAPMTYTIGLANGAGGYLPTKEDFRLGGYTTWRTLSSWMEEGAEEKIRLKLIEMVNGLFE
ncbi:MAG: hypothetical protein E7029_12920 [Planctomycetaceae bacterium]|nr:hypothetical protein [Planctomycetaceae bacterium]